MTGPTLRQKVLVTNPQGFHMRPAAAFATHAMKFPDDVHVIKEDQRADGKSVFGLLSLFAPAGTELTIEVTGEHADALLPTLVEIVNTPFKDPE
jgi:phosphotransferase system HPr (HPr) family protein